MGVIKKSIFTLFVLSCLLPGRAWAWDETPIHDRIVEIFKDFEAIFSWHMEDRKTLKEVSEEAGQAILS